MTSCDDDRSSESGASNDIVVSNNSADPLSPPSPGARLQHLPRKPRKQEEKHRKEHAEMLERVRLKKLEEEQLKRERELKAAQREQRMRDHVKKWSEMLAAWDKHRNSKKVRSLALQGIPPRLRGNVWATGVGNQLRITPQLYKIFLDRAADTSARVLEEERQANKLSKDRFEATMVRGCTDHQGDVADTSNTSVAGSGGLDANSSAAANKEGSVVLIQLDLPRTFPMLSFFQQGSPMFEDLSHVLQAYCCYRPDIGYVQGMSYLAAILLLQMSATEAFVCLANIMNTPSLLVFYKMNADIISKYITLIERLLKEFCPRVIRTFKDQNIMLEAFVVDWILTLFSKSLPLETAVRVWDCFVCMGEVAIFKAMISLLQLLEPRIVSGGFEENMHLLTHLPDDIDVDQLLKKLDKLSLNDKKWLSLQKEFVGDTPSILLELGA